jgi:hypothetical protein
MKENEKRRTFSSYGGLEMHTTFLSKHLEGRDCFGDQDIDGSMTLKLVMEICNKDKAVLLHAMVALGSRGGIAPTHS